MFNEINKYEVTNKINSNNFFTVKDILEKVSQEDLFKYYYNYDVILERKFYKALHRKDKNPSCTFKYFGYKLRLCDWGTGDFLDIFDLLGITYNISFRNVILKIVNDFDLINNKVIKIDLEKLAELNNESESLISEEKRYCKIECEVFSKYLEPHVYYWNKLYHISAKNLFEENVEAVKYAWINNNLVYSYKKDDLAFLYRFPDNSKKLYFPYRPKGQKWRGTTNYVDGWNLLPTTGDLIVITSSKKDRMVLKEFNIPSICTQSETFILGEEKVSYLEKHFDYVIINPDRDVQGLKMARNYKEKYSLKSIFSPYSKDISGMIKDKGFDFTLKYVNNLKSKLLI